MVEHGQGPRSGSRDNGLRCAGYIAIGDLDPRVADDLLETLRAEGIAAYVSPTPGDRGGYLEVKLPARLTDRLYADAEHAARAAALLAAAPQEALPEEALPAMPTGTPTPAAASDDSQIDFESAWQQLLGSLQSGTTAPLAAPMAPMAAPIGGYPGLDMPMGGDPALDEHYIPPPPPPLPRLRKVTVISLLAIVAGLVVLVTNFDGGDLVWLAVLAILAGGGALIYHVKEGPPTDSGWDDGAVV